MAERPSSTLPVPGGGQPLPAYARVGVVCAHPDDESFGLGAVIATLVDRGAQVALVSLTQGEASTLGAAADLATRRGAELRAAAVALGIDRVTVGTHPDSHLADVPRERLVDEVLAALGDVEVLVTFDHGGVSGHPDHQHATDVAVDVGRRLAVPVLGWTVPEHVAARLRDEFRAPFVGREAPDLHHRISVERARQRAAIACHTSQHNPVPYRRIELLGDEEYLRVLHRP
jgi:LmbE family N-acetylglucosaminyl deacetylase